MNSTITKRNSVIHCAWDMKAASQTPLRHVTVQQHWQYVMPWSATWEASPHNTARYETSQHLLLQKSATMLPPMHTCSHSALKEIDLIISKYIDNNARIDIYTRGLWDTKCTGHNLQQESAEEQQETKGTNEKWSIDNWVVHQANQRAQAWRQGSAGWQWLTFCSQVASTEEALMHCTDSCTHTLSNM